ncbi:MAG: DNA repair protein RecO [Anaerolineaceae bacterium]|nr:DNA repair protein RecO [Anaerolineaceae bacterium]
MKPSERLKKVEAVIISHKDFGEADRLVNLFSLEGGRIKALAKGARKIRSRKAAYLEPFMHSKIVLARGKTFWIVTQADALHHNLAIRDSLEKTGQAAYVMELVDRLSIEEEPAPAVFWLLVNTLNRINKGGKAFNILRFFELHLLDFAGFRPDMVNCVGCGRKITAQDQYFSAVQGGVLCPACGELHNHTRKVSENALRFLRHFQRSVFADIADISVPSAIQAEIDALVDNYISNVVERKLNTPDFIKQVNRLAEDDRRIK